MQVLELAGRALEDQVSEGGHAQVGATLWQEGGKQSSIRWLGACGMSPHLAWTEGPRPSQKPWPQGLGYVPVRRPPQHRGLSPCHRLRRGGLLPAP